MTDATVSTGAPEPPALSIVAGHPTAEETAAVTVVVTALAAAAASRPQPAPDGTRSAWSDRSRMLRPPVTPGPGAWRASALPR